MGHRILFTYKSNVIINSSIILLGTSVKTIAADVSTPPYSLIVAGGGRKYYTTDRQNWNVYTGSTLTNTMICVNGVWYAFYFGGSGSYYRSFNGINWTYMGQTPVSYCTGATWTGKNIVLSGQDYTNNPYHSAYSSDGVTWTGTHKFASGIGNMVVNDSSYVLLGGGSSSYYAYSTNDGESWTGFTNSAITPYAGCYNGSRWVLVGRGSTYNIATSDTQPHLSLVGRAKPFSTGAEAVDWDGTKFVACGSGTNHLAYSYNGTTWYGLGLLPGIGILYNVIWDGIKWYTTGTANSSTPTVSIYESWDGITWTPSSNVTVSTSGYDTYAIEAITRPSTKPPRGDWRQRFFARGSANVVIKSSIEVSALAIMNVSYTASITAETSQNPVSMNTTASLSVNSVIDAAGSLSMNGVGNMTTYIVSLKESIVFAWELNETTGTVVYDSHTTAINGTSVNCTLNQAANLGTAYSFNGNTSRISRASIGKNTMTVSLWYYLATGNTNAANDRLFGMTSYRLDITTNSTGGLQVYDGTWQVTGASLTLDSWNHVVLRKTPTSYELFLNGTSVFSRTVTRTILTTDGVYIGGPYTGSEYVEGLFSQVIYWQRYLTNDDIALLNNSGLGKEYSSF